MGCMGLPAWLQDQGHQWLAAVLESIDRDRLAAMLFRTRKEGLGPKDRDLSAITNKFNKDALIEYVATSSQKHFVKLGGARWRAWRGVMPAASATTQFLSLAGHLLMMLGSAHRPPTCT